MNPVVPEPFTEKTILSPLKCPGHPVKSVDLNVSLFLDSHFYILMPVPHCLDYCNFIVSFETGKHKSSNLFFEKNCFGYSGSLEFQDPLVIFCKEATRCFDRDCTESVGQSRECRHLNNVTFLIHKHVFAFI